MPTRAELAVGAIIVVDHCLLLVERGRPPAVGCWSVPGGRVEPGETLVQAVEREVAEETSLPVTCGPFVGWVERISNDFHFVIMDFLAQPVGGPRHRLPALAPGDDASRAAWVPLGELQSIDLVEGLESFLREHRFLPES